MRDSKTRLGRKTKLTPETQEKICLAIRCGSYVETAAAHAGVSKQTLYTWLRKGERTPRNKTSIYKRFHAAVHRALATCEVKCVSTIVSASRKNWQAAAWRLERMDPDRWGRRDHVVLEMSVRKELDAALEKLERALPPREYERVLRVLADDTGGSKPLAELPEPQVH